MGTRLRRLRRTGGGCGMRCGCRRSRGGWSRCMVRRWLRLARVPAVPMADRLGLGRPRCRLGSVRMARARCHGVMLLSRGDLGRCVPFG